MRDERLLAAIGSLARAVFVPRELSADAYLDKPVAISHRQVTTQPSLVAKMVEALELRGQERVLEIGTGYGYETALLAMLAREVWEAPVWVSMTPTAARALTDEDRDWPMRRCWSATAPRGFPNRPPFDAIILAAAFPTVPPPLQHQLAAGGRLVQPIGPGGSEDVRLFEKQDERLVMARSITGAYFVPLGRAWLCGCAGACGALTPSPFRCGASRVVQRLDCEALLVGPDHGRAELAAGALQAGGDPLRIGSFG